MLDPNLTEPQQSSHVQMNSASKPLLQEAAPRSACCGSKVLTVISLLSGVVVLSAAQWSFAAGDGQQLEKKLAIAMASSISQRHTALSPTAFRGQTHLDALPQQRLRMPLNYPKEDAQKNLWRQSLLSQRSPKVSTRSVGSPGSKADMIVDIEAEALDGIETASANESELELSQSYDDVVEAIISWPVAQVAAAIGFSPEGVQYIRGPSGIRGLFAARDFKVGSAVLAVPLGAGLLSYQPNPHFEGKISAPQAPWVALKKGMVLNYTRLQRARLNQALPWNISMAAALLDLCNGAGGLLWSEYCHNFLPQPEDLKVPLNMPPESIDDADLAAQMQMQRAKLLASYPSLAEADGDDGLGRRGLVWAVSCVQSRSFFIGKGMATMNPFLDLANHAAAPNARVVSRDVSLRDLDFGGVPQGMLSLVTTRDVAKGEELTISYGNITNDELFLRYGFKMPEMM